MKVNPETVKMVNHVDLRQALEPVKVAEGPCPCCGKLLDVWLTGSGLELSVFGQGYDARTGTSGSIGEDGKTT